MKGECSCVELVEQGDPGLSYKYPLTVYILHTEQDSQEYIFYLCTILLYDSTFQLFSEYISTMYVSTMGGNVQYTCLLTSYMLVALQAPYRYEKNRQIFKDQLSFLGENMHIGTIYQRNSYSFYIVTFYIIWVTTFWTDSMGNRRS